MLPKKDLLLLHRNIKSVNNSEQTVCTSLTNLVGISLQATMHLPVQIGRMRLHFEDMWLTRNQHMSTHKVVVHHLCLSVRLKRPTTVQQH